MTAEVYRIGAQTLAFSPLQAKQLLPGIISVHGTTKALAQGSFYCWGLKLWYSRTTLLHVLEVSSCITPISNDWDHYQAPAKLADHLNQLCCRWETS